MMEGPLAHPSPATHCSTTGKRWYIRRATSVTNVLLSRSLSETSPALADYRLGNNTGYKSFDPSHPCRKCWERYSKPYSGPIIYASWNDGPSNRQRPLSNFRSSATNPSLSRSISSIIDRARSDLYSFPDSSVRRSLPPPSSPVYPPRSPLPTTLPPRPRPQSDYVTTAMSRSISSTWPRNSPPSPPVLQPGDPRIGGNMCWNCNGSGRTFGFLLLTNNTCGLCNGIGRLL